MEILNLQNTEMMTSREIAEFAKASHDNVLKNIRNIIAEGSVFKTTPLEREYVHPQNKQVYTELLLDFRSTMIVVAAYKSNVRAKIIDRWQELEKMKAPKAKTRLELARENVALIEEIEEKALQIENLSTALDTLLDWVSILKIAKHNKVNEKKFDWRKLKSTSEQLGYTIKKAESPRYGYQNLYHLAAFKACYPQYDYSIKAD